MPERARADEAEMRPAAPGIGGSRPTMPSAGVVWKWTTARWLVLALLVMTLAVLPVAFYSLFSGAPGAYDDEGFFLIAIKLVASGHPLYDDVVTGYGPFYWLVFVTLAHIIGGIDHNAGRWIVLVLWIAGSWVCGLVAFRLTRSMLAAILAFALSFRLGAAFGAEPMNPAPLINLLVLGLVGVGAASRLTSRVWAALGILVMLIALVKVNIGAYAGLALAFAVLACARQVSRLGVWLAGLFMLCIAPAVLMSPDFTQTHGYIALVAASGLGIVAVAASVRAEPLIDLRKTWLPLIAGGVGTAIVAFGLTIVAFHSSPGAFWQNIVALPGQQRDVFTVFQTVAVRPTLLTLLVVPLVVTGAWRRVPAPALAALKLTAAVAIALAVLLSGPFERATFAPVEWGLPLAWLVAIPNPGTPADHPTRFARMLVAALAVMESLYAYPVAGSQIGFASVFVIPVAAVCFADGIRLFAPLAEPITNLARIGAATAVACLVLWASAGAALADLANRYNDEVPLSVPGASDIHVPNGFLSRVRWVDEHMRPCSTFIPLLGMNSFYLWARKEPPGFMQQVWPMTLDRGHQREILQRLQGDPHVCLLVNLGLLEFWSNGRPLRPGPLLTFTRRQFRPWTTSPYGDQIWIRKDAPTPPG